MESTRYPALTAAALLLGAALLVSCATNQVDKSRSETFRQYETIIRWSQWDAAAEFLAPEYLAEHPITRLEMDRLRLFRVTNYAVRSTQIADEGKTTYQVAIIKMFNNAQAVERTIIDNQEWRYDEQSKRWLLHSGLPNPTKRY